jgi:hypothetical protein
MTKRSAILLRWSRSGRGCRSLVVNVMMVMMVMVMVVVVRRRRRRFGGFGRGAGRGAGDGGLRERVSRQAERQNGRGGKGLDHERTILWLGKPKWVVSSDRDLRLNSI